MDSDTESACVQQIDPKLWSKIVRTIAQIEKSFALATGPLSERFMHEVGAVICGAADDVWEVEADEWEVHVTSPAWKCTRGRARGDAWLELGDIVHDDVEHSWIAVAVAAGPAHLCLEFKFRNGLRSVETCLQASPQLASKLSDAGFTLHDDNTRLLIPIEVDADGLARAFESGKFEPALAPVHKAMRAAVAVRQELDDLVGLARMRAS